MPTHRALPVVFLLLLFLPRPASANEISLDLRRSWLAEQSFFNITVDGSVTTLRLGGRFEMGGGHALVAAVPLARASAEEEVVDPGSGERFHQDDSAEAMGNPFLGVDLSTGESPARLLLGAHLPLAPGPGDDSASAGAALFAATAEVVRNAESFVSDALPLVAELHAEEVGTAPVRLGLRGGLRTWIPIDLREDSEIFAVYGARLGFAGGRLHPSLFVDGRFHLSSEAEDGDDFYHVAGLALEARWPRVRPRLEIAVPVGGDLGDAVDWSGLLAVAVDLP